MRDRNRSMRIQTLVKLALIGWTYPEIFNKAMSWGICSGTARDYMKSVSAICNRKGQILEKTEDYKGKPNPYDPDEIVIGRGSDIIS